MIQRCRNWLRVVLPRGEFGLLVILGILVIDGLALVIWWREWPVPAELFTRYRVGLLGLAAFAYGIFRAVAFHPLCDADYRRWLELTPWKIEKPLLAGPLWLVPQDAIMILSLIGLNHALTPLNYAIPIVFLVGYLVSNLILNWLTGEWALSYLVAFALATLPLLHSHPEFILLIEVLCLAPAYWATRRSLQQFPWQLSPHIESQLDKSVKESQQQLPLGWPYDLLAPAPPKIWVKYHDGICLSLLLGWIEFTFFTMAFQLDPNPATFPKQFILFGTMPSAFACLINLAIIYQNHWSPIDLWGRIRTWRWFIPEYDKMAVAPLAAGVATCLLHATQRAEFGAVGSSVAFLILLVFSPGIGAWRLTGMHRVTFQRNQQFVQL